MRHAIEEDGWQITHDPYSIPVGRKHVFVDLGAEKLIAAEKSGRRIAVEVKTFGGPSDIHDFELVANDSFTLKAFYEIISLVVEHRTSTLATDRQ